MKGYYDKILALLRGLSCHLAHRFECHLRTSLVQREGRRCTAVHALSYDPECPEKHKDTNGVLLSETGILFLKPKEI